MLRLIFLSLFFAVISAMAVAEEETEEAPPKITQYIEIKPAFVANFGGTTTRLKYVKADVSLRVSSSEAASVVEAHFPLIRHEVVMLLSAQTEDTMSSTAGQEEVRKQALDLVNAALEEESGAPQIDDLLFTNFVVQR